MVYGRLLAAEPIMVACHCAMNPYAFARVARYRLGGRGCASNLGGLRVNAARAIELWLPQR